MTNLGVAAIFCRLLSIPVRSMKRIHDKRRGNQTSEGYFGPRGVLWAVTQAADIQATIATGRCYNVVPSLYQDPGFS